MSTLAPSSFLMYPAVLSNPDFTCQFHSDRSRSCPAQYKAKQLGYDYRSV